MNQHLQKVKNIVEDAQDIVIVQADNPDGDSIGSALALEQILHALGKTPHLYCGVHIPSYLRYLPGWDRVELDLPDHFDASIFVDVSTLTLLEKIENQPNYATLRSKPCIVIDHHGEVEEEIDFAQVIINDSSKSSAGEVLFGIARDLGWPIPLSATEPIMTAILGDTQGLSNDLVSSDTYRVMAELVDLGANRPTLENRRREYSKMPSTIFKYKADLIQRTHFYLDERLAIVVVTQQEIDEYSSMYNPGPLIQADMLQVDNVAVAIVLKRYDDGKTTAAIRSNAGFKVAGDLAAHFGGGGHPFAAGFKLTETRELDALIKQLSDKTHDLLESIHDEAI